MCNEGYLLYINFIFYTQFSDMSSHKIVVLYLEKYVLASLAPQKFRSMLSPVVRNYKSKVKRDGC